MGVGVGVGEGVGIGDEGSSKLLGVDLHTRTLYFIWSWGL